MNETIPEKLLNSKKYEKVCPDTVLRVWNECSAKYKKAKDAERAAREVLHGITGAFMLPADRARCIAALDEWAETKEDSALEKVLSFHASTRERLPLTDTDRIFSELFRGLPENFTVLDLACGIDPIYLAARGINVTGTDISGESVDLINMFGAAASLRCRAFCRDLLCRDPVPEGRYSATLLFKVLPLLDRQRKGAADEVLASVHADRIIVSFPTRTLSGRNVGMENHYTEWMKEHVPCGRHIAHSFSSDNEIFFIMEETKADSSEGPAPAGYEENQDA